MLGHKVWQRFRDRVDAWVTVRDRRTAGHPLFAGGRVITGVRADEFETVQRAWDEARPTAVVNCVGIVKQLKEASDPVTSITVNALFPHRVAALARERGARMIQISTDCVFSGARGGYTESDLPDARDLYGRTKLLGEVTAAPGLTLRTSIIGREMYATTGLVEWFLSHRCGEVTGYTQARFSGLTTDALAGIVGALVERQPSLSGLYNVASEPISKYDLLTRLNEAYRAGVRISASDEVRIDRSLDGGAFAHATGIAVPGWQEMIAALAADPTPYEAWRSNRV